MNRSTLNEMHAARRNHAMKLAHPQYLAPEPDLREARMDRHSRNTERSRSWRGPQIKQAMIDGAIRHFNGVKIGQRVSKVYDLVVEHFHREA